jgi:pimeloyl-ACP methyl ester carboxylesterase
MKVGVSMGGMIALKLAALVPQRIASLVLGVTSAGHGLRRKLPPVRAAKRDRQTTGPTDDASTLNPSRQLDGLEITARTLFDDELARYMLYGPASLS